MLRNPSANIVLDIFRLQKFAEILKEQFHVTILTEINLVKLLN